MLVSSALTERAAHGAVMGLLPAPLCRRRCRHGCACGTVEWRKVGARVLVRRNGGQHRHAARAVCAQPQSAAEAALVTAPSPPMKSDVTTDDVTTDVACERLSWPKVADDDLAALLHSWHAIEGFLVNPRTKAA